MRVTYHFPTQPPKYPTLPDRPTPPPLPSTSAPNRGWRPDAIPVPRGVIFAAQPLADGKMPVFGWLPAPDENPIATNVFVRPQLSALSLTNQEYAAWRAFTRSRAGSRAADWYSLNPGTFPVLTTRSAIKLGAAENLGSMISAQRDRLARTRLIQDEHINTLRALQSEVRDQLDWQNSDWPGLVNVLTRSVNAFSGALLDIVNIAQPAKFDYPILYRAITNLFKSGMEFHSEAWEGLIRDALLDATSNDVRSGGSILYGLLNTLNDFAAQLKEITDSEGQRAQLKRELETQLQAIEREIIKYNSRYSRPRTLEVEATRLDRPGNYVRTVNRYYRRYMGLPPTPPPPPPQTVNGPSLLVGIMPLTALLALRARETKVKAAEG